MAVNQVSEQSQVFKEIVRTLVSVLEFKDPFLKGHSERVAGNCVLFSRHLSMSRDLIDVIYLAGLLYDIGMVYLPVDIIHKPGALSPEEMASVKEHPKIAETILSNLTSLKSILPIIRHHHETYGGEGYPDGLKGENIPIGARILSIADSYDAMTSERPHRQALSEDDALAELRRNTGMMFDPRLVEEFFRFIGLKKDLQKVSEKEPQKDSPRQKESDITKAVHDVVAAFNSGHIELPVFPAIVQQIRQAIASANVTIDDLAKVIEHDPVVTLRLITVSNSVHYGGAGKVQTVRQAVARMGINATQDVISAIAMKAVYSSNNAVVRELMEKLWQHAIATAYMARAIALKLRDADAERLFLLGLTHDIGKVMLLQPLTTILVKRSKNQIDMEELMSSIHAVHAGFGGALLQRWGFGENIVQAIAKHETPVLTDQTPRILVILFLANMLTRRIGYSLFTDQPPSISHAILLLGLDVPQIDEIIDVAQSSIQKTIGSV